MLSYNSILIFLVVINTCLFLRSSRQVRACWSQKDGSHPSRLSWEHLSRELILFTHFHDFWSQIGVVILVTPKQEVERKIEWFCGVKFFHSYFEVEWENSVWTKIRFLDGGFLLICGNFTLIFTVFFGWDLFFNGLPNPCMVHSKPSFLFEPIFSCSLVVFCSHAAFWHWCSFFKIFYLIF